MAFGKYTQITEPTTPGMGIISATSVIVFHFLLENTGFFTEISQFWEFLRRTYVHIRVVENSFFAV